VITMIAFFSAAVYSFALLTPISILWYAIFDVFGLDVTTEPWSLLYVGAIAFNAYAAIIAEREYRKIRSVQQLKKKIAAAIKEQESE